MQHNTWFLGPTQVHNPDSISIDSAFFAGLTIVTDRHTDWQTDHATPSVTIGRISVRSTAMRLNNNNNLNKLLNKPKKTVYLTYMAAAPQGGTETCSSCACSGYSSRFCWRSWTCRICSAGYRQLTCSTCNPHTPLNSKQRTGPATESNTTSYFSWRLLIYKKAQTHKTPLGHPIFTPRPNMECGLHTVYLIQMHTTVQCWRLSTVSIQFDIDKARLLVTCFNIYVPVTIRSTAGVVISKKWGGQ